MLKQKLCQTRQEAKTLYFYKTKENIDLFTFHTTCIQRKFLYNFIFNLKIVFYSTVQ